MSSHDEDILWHYHGGQHNEKKPFFLQVLYLQHLQMQGTVCAKARKAPVFGDGEKS